MRWQLTSNAPVSEASGSSCTGLEGPVEQRFDAEIAPNLAVSLSTAEHSIFAPEGSRSCSMYVIPQKLRRR